MARHIFNSTNQICLSHSLVQHRHKIYHTAIKTLNQHIHKFHPSNKAPNRYLHKFHPITNKTPNHIRHSLANKLQIHFNMCILHLNQRLSDPHEAASQTLRAGLLSMQASNNARWEKSREDQLLRDKINNQVLEEERRMQAKRHDLDFSKSRAEIVDKITASGEKLILAIKMLEELGLEAVRTPNQKLQFDVRQQAVTLHKRQYAELTESLKRTEFQSPSCMEPMFENSRDGRSRARTDCEADEVNLPDD